MRVIDDRKFVSSSRTSSYGYLSFTDNIPSPDKFITYILYKTSIIRTSLLWATDTISRPQGEKSYKTNLASLLRTLWLSGDDSLCM